MKERILLALLFATVTAPAFAVAQVALPEPATMSLFGIGIAGAFVARKVFGGK